VSDRDLPRWTERWSAAKIADQQRLQADSARVHARTAGRIAERAASLSSSRMPDVQQMENLDDFADGLRQLARKSRATRPWRHETFVSASTIRDLFKRGRRRYDSMTVQYFLEFGCGLSEDEIALWLDVLWCLEEKTRKERQVLWESGQHSA
jgi:hypothetical protein